MSEPLEAIAARIARLALVDVPRIGRVGPGPVLAVVRDSTTGRIYVGLNTDVPPAHVNILQNAIQAQANRIARGEVIVVRTEPAARNGGHAEVVALNAAVRAREQASGKTLKETDLRTFELHILWMQGNRTNMSAARCEHCARITRGMAVTQSVFVAEGGRVGQVTVPQRGNVVRSGSNVGSPATTVSGTTNGRPSSRTGEVTVPQRGMVVPSGSNVGRPTTTTSGTINSGTSRGGSGGVSVGSVGGGLLNAVVTLAIPVIKRYFAEHLAAKWKKEEQDRFEAVLFYYLPAFNSEIILRSQEIAREKAAGRRAFLRVQTHREFTPTDMGPALTKLEVLGFHVHFEGDMTMDFTYLETNQGFFARAFKSYVTHQRDTYLFPI